MMFCDDENATVNRRASGNLSIMKKMALSLYKMMKPLENSKTLSNIKRGVAWGYEEMLERMLCGCDDKDHKGDPSGIFGKRNDNSLDF